MPSPIRYKIIWSFSANEDLADIYNYIELDSPQAADKVIDTLLDLGHSLEFHPNRFSVEENLKDAPLVFRSFPKWNYKIIYTVNEDDKTVIIARVFGTFQNPDKMEVQ